MVKERVKASTKCPSEVKSQLKPYAMKFLRSLLYVLPCFAFIFLMLAYVKILIITDFTGSNKILHAILSLSPSLGLGVLGYFGKKWLKFFHDQHSGELGSVMDMKSVNEAGEDVPSCADDNRSTDQGDCEIEAEQSATATDNDGESTQLLGKEHVTVQIEESNI